MDSFSEVRHVLEAAAQAEATASAVTAEQIAPTLGHSTEEAGEILQRLERAGLLHAGDPECWESTAELTDAGRQYADLHGEVDDEVIYFLPGCVDDLHGRAALHAAGRIMFAEYEVALSRGQGLSHARGLVPPAFIAAVDLQIATKLFAALVALLTRLGAEQPAGCVAEEILAANLLRLAEHLLDTGQVGTGLDDLGIERAVVACHGLFRLLQDADVRELFKMKEPSDASAAAHADANRLAGIADQRVEGWFLRFNGVPALAHLHNLPADR